MNIQHNSLNERWGVHRLKELKRLREVMVDYFVYENIYGSTPKSWHNYFYVFDYAARVSVK